MVVKGGHWFDHLDILFDVSPRWQDVMLDLSDEDLFRHLLASPGAPCAFPLLKKLAVWSPGSMESLGADAFQFFERFPALEELELRSDKFSDLMLLPLCRLHTFTLYRCPPDVLLRSSRSFHWAHVVAFLHNDSLELDAIPICALTLTSSRQDLLDALLGSLTAPRSKCPLASLSLGVRLEEDGPVSILELPHASGVETTVLAMVASRRPVFRDLRITGYFVLSAAAVQALGVGGMEVMLSH
ncbi:hypothetical protein B0H14DRAFT_3880239 [Mycena olivaceomarginata]|nr:hypothetical protein B0H14DRAFT_3880239 [Mycena olivaceomarginata]